MTLKQSILLIILQELRQILRILLRLKQMFGFQEIRHLHNNANKCILLLILTLLSLLTTKETMLGMMINKTILMILIGLMKQKQELRIKILTGVILLLQFVNHLMSRLMLMMHLLLLYK